MAKAADKYFGIDAWKITEEGFDPKYSQVAESVFSLGNEYMGVRGFFEEGYSGESLIGCYFNGVYSSAKLGEGGYKGTVNETEFMVNAVNWLSAGICIDREKLDIKTANISNYRRVLDMRNGLLSRSFVWTTASGMVTEILFERFLSMQEIHLGVQRITIIPLNHDGEIEISMEVDFGITHQMYGKKNHWHVLGMDAEPLFFEIEAEVADSKKYLYSGSRLTCDGAYTEQDYQEDKKIGKRFCICGKQGQQVSVSRIVWNDQSRETKEKREKTRQATFSGLLQESAANGNRFFCGNGYMGIRGTLEEYKKEMLPAINLGGIYDKVGDGWREPLNAPNPLFTKIIVNGEELSLPERIAITGSAEESGTVWI